MRIDDLARKTVVYVGLETLAGFVPYGTGFLCRFKFKHVGFNFIATAKHVIDTFGSDEVSFRLNRKDTGCGVITLKKYNGIPHADPDNDLVLFHIHPGVEIYDYLCIPINRDKAISLYHSEWTFGVGDEVCSTGLYTSHYGDARNIPIVRIGHIAAMPEEPIKTDFSYVKGYIVELRSIAGLSGSPVFVTPPLVWWSEDDERPQFRKGAPLHIPIGMLIGHHNVQTTEDEIQIGDDPEVMRKESAKVDKNTGFGVVVPVERIYEIMEYPYIIQAMNDSITNHHRASGFVPDAHSVPDRDG